MNTIVFGTSEKLKTYVEHMILVGRTILLPEEDLSWGDEYIWALLEPENTLPECITDTRNRKHLAIWTLYDYSPRLTPLILKAADESEMYKKDLLIHSENAFALTAIIRSRFRVVNLLPIPKPPKYWEVDDWAKYIER